MKPTSDLAERAFRRQKRRDAGLILPLVGVVLFCSPLISVFSAPVTVFGIPLSVFYLFASWLGLIAVARFLSVRLRQDRG